MCLFKRGVSLFTGSLLDFKKQYGKTKLTVRTNKPVEELEQLSGVNHVKLERDNQAVLTLQDESFAPQLFEHFSNGAYIEKFSLDYLSLHEIFKEKVGAGLVEV